MLSRDRLIAAAVTGISAALPFLLAFALLHYGVKSAEAFGFLGALGGAAFAVALALWGEGRKARAQRARETMPLLEEFSAMRRFARELIARIELASKDNTAPIGGALETLVTTNGHFAVMLDAALAHGQTLTFTERMLFQHCRTSMDAFDACAAALEDPVPTAALGELLSKTRDELAAL